MSKMVDLITLGVIEKIFDGLQTKAMSKSLYINCLIKNFKEKDVSVENSIGFEISFTEIKNLSKWYSYFEDLKNNGLINMADKKIFFINKWGQFINPTDYLKLQMDGSFQKSALIFEEGLKLNTSMIDVVGMKNKLSRNQVNDLIRIFVLEQDATQSFYKDLGECSKHFIYWVNTNHEKIDLSIEIVRSTSKILGIDEK